MNVDVRWIIFLVRKRVRFSGKCGCFCIDYSCWYDINKNYWMKIGVLVFVGKGILFYILLD
jgi:hypothetical protein